MSVQNEGMRPVVVQFLKFPDTLHWGFETVYLGEDEFGSWVALPAGSKRWKGDTLHAPTTTDAVFCAPREGWWHLQYAGSGRDNYTHFVDISTQPRWVTEGRYEMVDLDLDVALTPGGEVVVEDEDEFDIHQRLYGYSPEMIERALAETDRIVAALEAGQEPFFAVAERWLRQIR
jgi:uncharacterized protein